MFNLRKTSNDRYDGTGTYELYTPKGMTVKDFINYKIENNDKGFGVINFGPKLFVTDRAFKYSNFKDLDGLLSEYGDRIIQGPIKCVSAWEMRWDYWIELEPLVTNSDLYKSFLARTGIDPKKINDWRPCFPEYGVPYIPMALVIWLNDKTKLIYVHTEETNE